MNVVRIAIAVKVGDCGLAAPPSILTRGRAARERTSRITCTTWADSLAELNVARLDAGPMTNLAAQQNGRRLLDMPWWTSPVFADVLDEAWTNRSQIPNPIPNGTDGGAAVTLQN